MSLQKKFVSFETEDELFLIELDKDFYPVRQIIINVQGELHFSCFEDCLAEGQITEDLSESIKSISEKEFNSIWNKAIHANEINWRNNKNRYPIGTVVNARCKCFYPQGAILKGEDFIALYVGDDKIALNQTTSFTVIEYDDVNMWLITK